MYKKLATIGMAFAMVALVGALGTARADWFEFFVLEIEDPTYLYGTDEQVGPLDTTDTYLFPLDDQDCFWNSDWHNTCNPNTWHGLFDRRPKPEFQLQP
jgi:hypothetical protein